VTPDTTPDGVVDATPDGVVDAVVFDFDGLIVDTEWSIYEMARATFAEFDIDLEVPVWATIVGLAGESDWWGRLCETNGWAVDRDDWWRHYDGLDRGFRDHLPVLPGVVELLDDLDAASVPAGIASSSDRDWVAGHLGRLGLLDRFATIAGVDRTGGVGKPQPDSYLLACADLGAQPARSVAIEDSAHGVTAAKAAGMACVAVPSRITRHTDLSAADLTVDSLAELRLPDLSALVGADAGD
jgi:HAD superfamily hydrolase (TIGR01509 family)